MADQTKTCFIAMPVRTTEEHARIFGDKDHWAHVLDELFVPAVEAAGFQALRPVAKGSHIIHAQIVKQLELADMVLCDMSGNNPNVFFELGVRTSVNKPVALVRCDASIPIPFDVNNVNAHTYDPTLKSFLIESERERLAEHLREAEASCGGENPVWRQYGLELKAREPSSDSSAEDARLSLLTDQVESLTRIVEAQSRRPIIYDSTRLHRPSDIEVQSAVSAEPDERLLEHGVDWKTLVMEIELIAENYGLPVEVTFHPNEGVKILVRARVGGAVKEFKKHVEMQLSHLGLPFHVLARSGDGSIGMTTTV